MLPTSALLPPSSAAAPASASSKLLGFGDEPQPKAIAEETTNAEARRIRIRASSATRGPLTKGRKTHATKTPLRSKRNRSALFERTHSIVIGSPVEALLQRRTLSGRASSTGV